MPKILSARYYQENEERRKRSYKRCQNLFKEEKVKKVAIWL